MSIRPYIRPTAFLLMLLGITLAFLGMVSPFLMAIFWAALLALIFKRPYRLLNICLRGRRNLAAALASLIIVLIVLIPIFFISLALVNESISVYRKIESGEWDLNKVVEFVQEQSPYLEEVLEKVGMSPEGIRENLSNFAISAARAVADRMLSYTQNAILLVANAFLMLYMLFFFLRDGRKIERAIINVLPFGNAWERLLVRRFSSVARATLKGTLIVAVVQGSMGGVLFAILGIDGAVFWGVVMTILSLLPVAGSGLVWGPAAIIMAVQGMWGKTAALVIVGSLGIGLIDNVLRPILVGRDTEMPDYLVLIATLGGLGWFGLSGFVLGPVIAALFITFWQTTGKEYGGGEE
jgi:predicted PurR-regulated permease PerM